MKSISKILISIFLPVFLGGCISFNNPENVLESDAKYGHRNFMNVNQSLIDFSGKRILIEAPEETESYFDDNGKVIRTETKPVFVKTDYFDKDGNKTSSVTEPVVARIWVKDTGAKRPMTLVEGLVSTAKIGLAAYLGGEAFGVIEAISTMKSRDPLIVEPTVVGPDIVSVNGTGDVKVSRG